MILCAKSLMKDESVCSVDKGGLQILFDREGMKTSRQEKEACSSFEPPLAVLHSQIFGDFIVKRNAT